MNCDLTSRDEFKIVKLMFNKYNIKTKEILSSASSEINWKIILEKHKQMIAIIQHERLIHLLVTIFVGISMLLCFLTTIITQKFYLLLLDIPLFFLFIGYIFHYRYLENTTQTWYELQNLIEKKL